MLDATKVEHYQALAAELYRAAGRQRINLIGFAARLLEEQAADAIIALLAELGHFPKPSNS